MSKISVECSVFTYNFLGVKAMVAVVGGVIVLVAIIVAVVFTASATETACNTGFFNFPTCEGKLYDTFTNSYNSSFTIIIDICMSLIYLYLIGSSIAVLDFNIRFFLDSVQIFMEAI